MTTNTTEQLELGTLPQLPRRRRETRVARARWWFAQMREAVAKATDWSAVTPPPPEQIWIPGVHREVGV